MGTAVGVASITAAAARRLVTPAPASLAMKAGAGGGGGGGTCTRWRLAPPITTSGGMACTMAYMGMTLRAVVGAEMAEDDMPARPVGAGRW